jgi:hypothetical protein
MRSLYQQYPFSATLLLSASFSRGGAEGSVTARADLAGAISHHGYLRLYYSGGSFSTEYLYTLGVTATLSASLVFDGSVTLSGSVRSNSALVHVFSSGTELSSLLLWYPSQRHYEVPFAKFVVMVGLVPIPMKAVGLVDLSATGVFTARMAYQMIGRVDASGTLFKRLVDNDATFTPAGSFSMSSSGRAIPDISGTARLQVRFVHQPALSTR